MAQGFATESFGEIWFLRLVESLQGCTSSKLGAKKGWGLAVAPSCGGMLSTCSVVGADITRQRCSGTTQAGYSGLGAWFFSGLPAIHPFTEWSGPCC